MPPQQQRPATRQPTEHQSGLHLMTLSGIGKLSSVQHSMRKGDIHSAYKCPNQLSKPKTKAGRTLQPCSYVCWISKAFDSVDRHVAWQILLSRGVPPRLVALIKDLHTSHTAIIRAVFTDTGFKQGCVLAPDLFNVTLDTIVRQLLPQLQN